MPANQGYMPLLRSFVAFLRGFYRHVALSALWIGFRILGVFQQAANLPPSQPSRGKIKPKNGEGDTAEDTEYAEDADEKKLRSQTIALNRRYHR